MKGNACDGGLGRRLPRIENLLRQSRQEFVLAVDPSHLTVAPGDAWSRVLDRRSEAVRIVEQLPLKLALLQPAIQDLHDLAGRWKCSGENRIGRERSAATEMPRATALNSGR